MQSRVFRVVHVVASLALACGVASAAQTVGYLQLKGELPEREQFTPLFAGADDEAKTLHEVIQTLHEVASEESGLSGVVIRLQNAQLGRAQIDEIGAAIGKVREAGKKVHVFTEIYSQSDLLLGSYADDVIVQKGGAVTLTGLYMEEMFLADMLRWVGASPDFVQIGDYKGAKEAYANSKPSPEWDQNINQLLDSMYETMTSRLMRGRGLNEAKLSAAMNDGMFMEPEDAVKHGLADRVLDRLELDEHLESIYGEDFAWDSDLAPDKDERSLESMSFFEAFAELMRAMEGTSRTPTRDTIAVVYIDGPIVDGESASSGLLGGASVGSLTIRKALKEIEDDDHIKGVVVRIVSPGGSAIASESIWLGLRRIAEISKKPVWTSVGDMAASGGYYIAVAGERIYLDPGSIVGSIGVVGGKFALGGVFEKLKINVVPRARGPLASIMGTLSEWSDAERDSITRSMKRTYELFTSRVKAGRPEIDLAATAEGRLFTGELAIERKMADKIGGLDAAITEMASTLGIEPGEYDVLDYPAPRGFEEMFKQFVPMGQASASAALVQPLRELVGEQAWNQIRAALTAMMQLRHEPVILASPRVLLLK